VEAACEQSAQLTGPAVSYLRRRTAELTAGRLRVTVSHDDVLSVPR
jgi:hypothetical protein